MTNLSLQVISDSKRKSGLQYLVVALMFLTALPAKAQWQNVGPAGFTPGAAEFQSLAITPGGSLYIAFRDLNAEDRTSVMTYNYENEIWSYVGTAGFSEGISTHHGIAFKTSGGHPFVIFEDNDVLNRSIVMQYNGTSWVHVGPADSFGDYGVPERNTGFQCLAFQPSTNFLFVALQARQRSSRAMVWWLNGDEPGEWLPFGEDEASSIISDGEAREIDLAFNPVTNRPYVAFRDMANNFGITVMRHNGSEWEVVGTKGFTGSGDKPSLAFHPGTGEVYVAYQDNANDGLSVMRFDGSAWNAVGPLGFTPKSAFTPSLTFHPSTHKPYVAFTDFDKSSKASVMKFNDTSWEFVGQQGFSAGPTAFNSLAFHPISHELYLAFKDEADPDKGATVMMFKCDDPTHPTLEASLLSVCEGKSATISISGEDFLGSATAWYLYSGSCGGTLVESNATGAFIVAPSSTTTYFVRGEGGCIEPAECAEITITVKQLPEVNAGEDESICMGDEITLSGSGAVSYTWDNEVLDGIPFAPTASATYTVSGIGENGCTNTDEITVTVHHPVVNAGSDQVVCAGESLTLSGKGASSYTWDNGVTDDVPFVPTETATYTVTGIDEHGCSDTDEVTVIVQALPSVEAGTDLLICPGESVTLSGSGAISYTWDNGVTDEVPFTPATSAIYTVTGTDANNCKDTDQVSVDIKNINSAVSVSGLTLATDATGATFRWIDCMNNEPIAGETKAEFTPAMFGSYAVEITQDGCTILSSCVDLSITNIEQMAMEIEVTINPTPSARTITIHSSHENFEEVSIRDINGRMVFAKKNLSTNMLEVPVDTWSDGIFLALIKLENNKFNLQKILKY